VPLRSSPLKKRTFPPLFSFLFVFLLGVGIGNCFSSRTTPPASAKEESRADDTKVSLTPPSTPTEEKACLPDFADLVEKVQPAVVNIWTTRRVSTVITPFDDPDLLPPPFRDFFRRFFPDQPPRRRQEFKQYSLGSGFIIDSDGFVVTNNHVVQEADEIKVTTADGRSFDVEVVGKDPKTDLALLKIKGKGPFPYLSFGDSDTLRVGEWVIAVGNPFGLSHTVTVGIVSAKGRTIRQGPYDDFIQTDASINPGNSGGPLLNVRGEVIGVNTAIFSRTGQSAGIGFAIPSNLARYVVQEIKTHKRVARGYLGVIIQPVDETIARAMGLPEPKGALVSQVNPNTPAEKAGIKAGDIIVKYNGAEIHRFNELPVKVSTTPPGSKVTLEVIREGKPLTFTLTLAELPENIEGEQAPPEEGESEENVERGSIRILGMTVRPLSGEERQEYKLPQGGLIVVQVEEGSPAHKAGIQPGDLLLEANRTPIRTPDDLRKVLAQAKGRGASALVLYIRRGDQNRFVGVEIP